MSRKSKILGLVTAFVVSAFAYASTANAYTGSGGTGTAEDPYLVSSQADLEALASEVNAGNSFDNVYFEQSADITTDYTDGSGFTPIGTSTYPFNGNYNGNGHEIRGIEITASDSSANYGLFGYIGTSGIVHDLSLAGISVSGDGASMGGVAGVNAGTIRSVIMEGTVGISGKSYLGAVVGQNLEGATIENVYANASGSGIDSNYSVYSEETPSTASDQFYIGGIAGHNAGTIQDSAIGRMLSVTGPSGIGGIAGTNTGIIRGCYIEGNVTTNKWIDIDTPTLVGPVAAHNGGTIQNTLFATNTAGAITGTTTEQIEITDGEGNGTGEYEDVETNEYSYVNTAVGSGSEPNSDEVKVLAEDDTTNAGVTAVGFIYTQPRAITGVDGDVTEAAKSGSRPFPYNGLESQYSYSTDDEQVATVAPCPDSEMEDPMSGTVTVPGFYAPQITITGAGETEVTWTFTTVKLMENSADTSGRTYSTKISVNSDPKYVEYIYWDTAENGHWEGTSLKKGDTRQLKAYVTPEDVTDSSISYSSDNVSVATVNDDGTVTAVGNGTVTITAKANGAQDPDSMTRTKTFEVRTAITGLTASEPNKSVEDGATVSLSVTAEPAGVSLRTVTWYTDTTGTGDSYTRTYPDTTLNDNMVSTTSKVINFNDSDTVLIKAVSGGDVIDGTTEAEVEAVFTIIKRDTGTIPTPDPDDGIIDATTGSGVIPVSTTPGESSYINDYLQGNGASGSVYVPTGIDGSSASSVEPNGSSITVSHTIDEATALSLVTSYWDLQETDVAKATIVPASDTAVTTYSYTPGDDLDYNTYLPLDLKILVPKSSVPTVLYSDATVGNYLDTENPSLDQILSYVHLFAFINDGSTQHAVSISDICGTNDQPSYRKKYITVTDDGTNYVFNVRLLVFNQTGGRDSDNNNGGKNLWVSTIEDPASASSANQLYLALQDGADDSNYTVSLGAACMTTNDGEINVTITGEKASEPDTVSYTIRYGQGLGQSASLTGTNQKIENVEPGNIEVTVPTFSGLSCVVWEVVGEEKTAMNGPTSLGDTLVYTSTISAGETKNIEIEYGTKQIESLSFSDIELEITSGGGSTGQIELNILPDDAIDRAVTYQSADDTLVTVDETGLVTAVGTGGYATATVDVVVTAVNGGATYTGHVTVIRKPDTMVIEGADSVEEGSDSAYTVTFTPDYLGGSEVTWSVVTESSTGSGTIDPSTGVFSATSAGTVTIRATFSSDANYTAEKTITIVEPLQDIEVDTTSYTLTVGDQQEFTVTFTPTTASDKSITWSSTDRDVASIYTYYEETGVATISANGPGTAVITGTPNASTSVEPIEISVRVMGANATDSDVTIVDELINMGSSSTGLPSGINTDSSGILSPSKAEAVSENGQMIDDLATQIKNQTASIKGVPDTNAAVISYTNPDGTSSNMKVFTSEVENQDAYWLTDAVVAITKAEIDAALGDEPSYNTEDFVVTVLFQDAEGNWFPVYLNNIDEQYYTIASEADGGITVTVPAMVFDKEATVTSEQCAGGSPYLMPFAAQSGSVDEGNLVAVNNYLMMDDNPDSQYKFAIAVSIAYASEEEPEDPEDPEDPDAGEDEPAPTPEPDDGGGSGCNAGLGGLALLAGIPLIARKKK